MRETYREGLNWAIKEIITHKYKKDCIEAHNLVADYYGYDVYKDDGCWCVRSPETHRTVYVAFGRLYFNPYVNVGKWVDACRNIDKFDFVGCLAKPVNRTYHALKYEREHYKSEAVERYDTLRRDKLHIKSWQDNVERYRKSMNAVIDSYVRDIEYAVVQEAESEARLERHREEFGLKKRW